MKFDIGVFLILLTFLLFLMTAYVMKIRILVVTSNSMMPTFGFGDVLLAVRQEHYQPSDVISFLSTNSVVTHRIVSIHNFSEYQTKGDANETADLGLVSHSRVLGKVRVIIPSIGYLILFLQSKLAVFSFVLIAICIAVYKLIFGKFQQSAK